MRKAKFTDEEIIGAGELVQSQGKDVSPNAIKTQLGGGNPARIKQVWDRYRADSDAKTSEKSPLKEPLDSDDKFALAVDSHVKNAAYQAEDIFLKLLDKIKHDTEKRFDKLLERQENEHHFEMGKLKGELKGAWGEANIWKEDRNALFDELMKKKKEIEALSDSVDSMSKQIDKLKNKQSD